NKSGSPNKNPTNRLTEREWGSFMAESSISSCFRRLVNPSEDFTSVDGLAFLSKDALDGAALGRADFVLHLHGFDDQETLASFDVVSCFDEETHDFARHGRYDLLAAFGLDVAGAAAAPGASVDDFGGEFPRAGLEFQF